MNSETISVQNGAQKGDQGTPSTQAPPSHEVYASMLMNGYKAIVKASAKAQPLQKAFITEMQKTAGYEASQGVTILKDVQGNVSGVTDSNGTFYNVKGALAGNLLTAKKAEPSQALKDAIAAVDAAVKEFNKTSADAIRPLLVGVPKKGKNVNMPSNGMRTPSKGYISQEEWDSISDEEKTEFEMTYDGTAITLLDVNGEEHVCKSFGALKRHESGEGHKQA